MISAELPVEVNFNSSGTATVTLIPVQVTATTTDIVAYVTKDKTVTLSGQPVKVN